MRSADRKYKQYILTLIHESQLHNNNNNYNNIIPQVRTDQQYNIQINTVHLQLDAGEERQSLS